MVKGPEPWGGKITVLDQNQEKKKRRTPPLAIAFQFLIAKREMPRRAKEGEKRKGDRV